MHDHRPFRLRQALLLLAALLHLAGAAALPVLHAVAPAPASAAAVAPAPDDDRFPLPAHDERHCLVCASAGALALPVDPAEVLLASGRDAAPVPRAPRLRPAARCADSLARAPPALS